MIPDPQGLADPPTLARSASEGNAASNHDHALLSITDEIETLLSSPKKRR